LTCPQCLAAGAWQIQGFDLYINDYTNSTRYGWQAGIGFIFYCEIAKTNVFMAIRLAAEA
jgi:hypothetical protein